MTSEEKIMENQSNIILLVAKGIVEIIITLDAPTTSFEKLI
jgi:hypothetical protein